MRTTRACVSWSAHLRRVGGVGVAGSTWQTASADLCRSAITALAPEADHSSEEATMSLSAYDGAHSVLKPQAAAVASGTVASSRKGRSMGAGLADAHAVLPVSVNSHSFEFENIPRNHCSSLAIEGSLDGAVAGGWRLGWRPRPTRLCLSSRTAVHTCEKIRESLPSSCVVTAAPAGTAVGGEGGRDLDASFTDHDDRATTFQKPAFRVARARIPPPPSLAFVPL